MYRRELGQNPVTLDPAFVTDTYGGTVVRQVFDGLVQFDALLKPIPALAEFWEASQDGCTWTFTLRRGVTFHHGREVTAHDVVYSFTRLLDPQKPLPVAALTQEVADSLRPVATEKQISLAVVAADPDVTAWADRDKVTQVLLNLMGNAVKFTPPQGK